MQSNPRMSNSANQGVSRPAGKPATGRKLTWTKLKADLAMIAFVIVALAAAGLTTIGALNYLAFNVAVPARVEQTTQLTNSISAVSPTAGDAAQQGQ